MATHLTKVGATYYFRRVVPHELRPYFLTASGQPRVEFMVSLWTKDRRTAEELCRAEGTKLDTQFRAARAKLDAGVKPEQPELPIPAPPFDKPWDPFPTREDFEHFEDQRRFNAEQDWEWENDPVRQRIASAVEAALEQREQENRQLLAEMAAEAKANKPEPKGTRLAVLVDQYAAERKPNANRSAHREVITGSWSEGDAPRQRDPGEVAESRVGTLGQGTVPPQNATFPRAPMAPLCRQARACLAPGSTPKTACDPMWTLRRRVLCFVKLKIQSERA